MFTRTAAKYGDIAIVAGLDIAQVKQEEMAAPPSYPVFIVDGKSGKIGIDSALDCIKDIDIDVAVDFSHPTALGFVLALAKGRSISVVLATTGYTDPQMAEIDAAAGIIPIFQAPNMSIGITLMNELIRTAAAALADGFDIELVEAHHNQKLDAPSGTAMMLADTMKAAVAGGREYVYDRHNVRAKRGKNEIGIHTIRGGTIVGEHKAIFAGTDELIEIKHTAASREVFAEGAVRAVRFIAAEGRKPGRYSMRDVIIRSD